MARDPCSRRRRATGATTTSTWCSPRPDRNAARTDPQSGRRAAEEAQVGSVGVVVPCYRYGHFLQDAVDSVLDDPTLDVRVLIVDDASPDDSAERARELARRDPRIEVAVHPENRGHIATYNEGLLEWCDADYTVLLSADDR